MQFLCEGGYSPEWEGKIQKTQCNSAGKNSTSLKKDSVEGENTFGPIPIRKGFVHEGDNT